jgi:hypothetical protein
MIASLCAAPVWAEEDKPTVNLSVDALSQYVWRGYALSDDGSAVFQPSVTVTYKGFALNLWGNFDTEDHNPVGSDNGAAWNETDFTFSYSHEIVCGLTGTAGILYYALDKVDDSTEAFAGLSYASPWLTVGVTGYREFAHYPGWWVQFDLSRNFKLPVYDMSLDLGASFIYQDAEDSAAYPDPPFRGNDSYSDWHAGILSAALNIPVGKYITISPKLGYSFPLTSKAGDIIEALSWDHDKDHFFGGIRISAAF